MQDYYLHYDTDRQRTKKKDSQQPFSVWPSFRSEKRRPSSEWKEEGRRVFFIFTLAFLEHRAPTRARCPSTTGALRHSSLVHNLDNRKIHMVLGSLFCVENTIPTSCFNARFFILLFIYLTFSSCL